MIALVYISCGLIFHGFHALEAEFLQLNLLYLRPGYHYTPVGHQKTSHGGLVYTLKMKTLQVQGFEVLKIILHQKINTLMTDFQVFRNKNGKMDNFGFSRKGNCRSAVKLAIVTNYNVHHFHAGFVADVKQLQNDLVMKPRRGYVLTHQLTCLQHTPAANQSNPV